MTAVQFAQAYAWLTAAICFGAAAYFSTDRDRAIRLAGGGVCVILGAGMIAIGVGWWP